MQLAALTRSPECGVCLCDFRIGYGARAAETHLTGSPRFRSTDPLAELVDRWEADLMIPVHALLFRRYLFDGADPLRFDETLPNHEDWDCWIRMFRQSPGVCVTEKVLATYRLNPHSLSMNHRRMWEGFKTVCDKYDEPELFAPLQAKKNRMRPVYMKRILRAHVGESFPGFVRVYKRWVPAEVRRRVRRWVGLPSG
jgi:hypothetical protein